MCRSASSGWRFLEAIHITFKYYHWYIKSNIIKISTPQTSMIGFELLKREYAYIMVILLLLLPATKEMFGFIFSKRRPPMYSTAIVKIRAQVFSQNLISVITVIILFLNKFKKLTPVGSRCFTSHFQPVVVKWKWWTWGLQLDSVTETKSRNHVFFFFPQTRNTVCKRNKCRQKKEEQEVKEEISFDKWCKNERDITLSDTWARQKSTLIYVW